MKIKILGIMGCLLVAVLLAACVGKKNKEIQGPEFVLSYAENQSEDYPTTLGAYKFAELVEERTAGRIKIMVQAEGKLGYEKQVIEQLQFGGVDFARVSLAEVAEFAPSFNVLQMPYLYKSSEHMWKVLDSKIGSDFLNAVKDYDMIGLSWYDAGARSFYNCARPIKSLEDIKGLKIRVQESEMMADLIEELGGIAVPMVYDEVYSSLERGVVDGAENNWPSYESTGHYEVAKYYTLDEHTRIPEMQLCAKATWDKLLSEDQEIIKSCARQSALYERKLWREREQKSQEIAAENGVQITVIAENERERFKEAVADLYDKYAADNRELIEDIISMGEKE